MLRYHGANLHELNNGNESRVGNAYPIDAERKILDGVMAIVPDVKVQVKLIAFADYFSGRSEGCSLRITNVNLQFASVALRCGWQREEPHATYCAENPNESRHRGLDVVPEHVSC